MDTKQQVTPAVLPEEVVTQQIYSIRDQKVMLDRDLAVLYGYETKRMSR